jgi:hypothetical protein
MMIVCYGQRYHGEPMALFRAADWQLFPGGIFPVGINYPWLNYGTDFGMNLWDLQAGGDGKRGVSDTINKAKIAADFGQFSASGITAVRWFALCDCRAGVKFDANGFATGLDAQVTDDLEALLRLAAAASLRIDLVLLDFLVSGIAQTDSKGVKTFGHADIVAENVKSDAFIQNVVTPLASHFKRRQEILSWEVINEPDWCVKNGTVNATPMTPGVTWPVVAGFVGRCAAAIHAADVGALVTVGTGLLSDLGKLSAIADLDYLQVHYYPSMTGSDDLYGRIPAMSATAKPLVVGEFCPHGTDDFHQSVNYWFSQGAAAAWPWAWNDVRCGGANPDLGQLQAAAADVQQAIASMPAPGASHGYLASPI